MAPPYVRPYECSSLFVRRCLYRGEFGFSFSKILLHFYDTPINGKRYSEGTYAVFPLRFVSIILIIFLDPAVLISAKSSGENVSREKTWVNIIGFFYLASRQMTNIERAFWRRAV